jgi:hypothetical protein
VILHHITCLNGTKSILYLWTECTWISNTPGLFSFWVIRYTCTWISISHVGALAAVLNHDSICSWRNPYSWILEFVFWFLTSMSLSSFSILIKICNLLLQIIIRMCVMCSQFCLQLNVFFHEICRVVVCFFLKWYSQCILKH